jgi:stage II sporulation protein GA (sporulation sigma-E factor processing peptidase)
MLPGYRLLGNTLWRMVCLAAMAGIAFGWNISALRRGTIFVLLSMALGGMATGIGRGDFASLILAAAGVLLLCALGVRSPLGIDKYQPVELCWNGQKLKLTALVDTGNTLSDPITGASVLVVGVDVGRKLGISREIIHDPISALAKGELPGARLIPYRAVGKPGGMLLMLRFDRVLLGKKEISPMVAFAPEEIGSTDGYQALAGGTV